MSTPKENKPLPGLPVDLRGKRAFVAGVADDNGYGWAIAKSLAAAGAEIIVGIWALNIFESSLRHGKFDESRTLPDDSLMEITKVYPMESVFDSPEDVPEDVKTCSGASKWTVQRFSALANGDIKERISCGHLCMKFYSFVSLLKHFVPILNPGGSSISLTYIASERIIPGFGGGVSSAKAALESDTQFLAFEAGRKYKIRVKHYIGRGRGNAAAFLASPLASAITGAVVYVDNGLNAMGVGVDSPIFLNLEFRRITESLVEITTFFI
ncbi:hypothetical protein GH714_031698 [Hevea brasiliensis]|uniref:Uncharacterized protein n=1 Tax=Hevea brasiliensis TaxID=3981 RepID=A0A6A6M603_HEVBR|nr:hypothetical protein GH714_031698 [Hevea brasiliensis]